MLYVNVNSCNINFDILHNIVFEEVRIKEIHRYMHHFLWFTEDIMLFSLVTENYNLLCVVFLDEIYSKDKQRIQYVVFQNY